MHTILLVEDDAALAELIKAYLESHEYCVYTVSEGCLANSAVAALKPDLVILDIMLPGLNGLEVCKLIRVRSTSLPIIMLTARGEADTEVLGFEVGADDYVAKPCEPRILLARIRNLIRRTQNFSNERDCERIEFGNLKIELTSRRVVWMGSEVDLFSSEYDLLLVLASNPGKVMSRDDLIQSLRGIEFNGVDRSVDMTVSKLRRRFEEDTSNPRKIRTVWGKGYLFNSAEWES